VKRKTQLILILVVTFFLVSLPVTASAVTEVVSPPTESTINGIPESQIIRPMDVLVGPVFDSYTPNTVYGINKFKLIAHYTHDNSRNTTSFPMTVTITHSTQQGSEWTGSVTFTGEIKLGILAKVGATVGGSYKEYRSTNEAVGIQGGPLIIEPGKVGHIKMYYKGYATGGTLRTYLYFTQNPDIKGYTDTIINAKFYPSDYVDVFSEAWQE